MIFTDDQIIAMFIHHPPKKDGGNQTRQYAEINAAAAGFVTAIQEWAPDGADRDMAVMAVRQARMWANSAIALEGKIGWPLYSVDLPVDVEDE